MSVRVVVVGISGFGGGEAMRWIAGHPSFELAYAAGQAVQNANLICGLPEIAGLDGLPLWP